MEENRFLKLLETSPLPVLRDGAMGTLLHSRGVSFDSCFDALNLSEPALVGDIHRAYIEAGAQLLQTNTFGANRYKLAAHGLEDRVAEINRAGVDLARRVIYASFKDLLIAGDVGPLGVRLAPFGRVQPEEARAAFVEQIAALAGAGVDVISLETFTDLYEIREALAAARQVCELPVIASMTFTRDDRTLLGDGPEKVAQRLVEMGADVIGINLGQLPGAGTDRAGVELGAGQFSHRIARPQVRRQQADGGIVKKGCKGLAEGERDGKLVYLGGLDRFPQGRQPGRPLVIVTLHHRDGKDHIIGVEGGAVTPAHIRAQEERVRQIVCTSLPALGQVRHNNAPLIQRCQTVEQQGDQITINIVVMTQQGVEILRIARDSFAVRTSPRRNDFCREGIGGVPEQGPQQQNTDHRHRCLPANIFTHQML